MFDRIDQIESTGIWKTIYSNSLWLISGELLSKVIVFVFVIIIARKLGVTDFGIYGFALSLVMIFSMFVDCGLTTLITREVSREKNLMSTYVSNVLIMRTILSAIFLFIIVIALSLMDVGEKTRILSYLLWGWISILHLSQVFRGVFKAIEKMKYEFYLTFSHSLLRLILLIAFLAAGLRIIGVGMSMLFAAIITLFISAGWFMKNFKQSRWQVHPRLWYTLFIDALPLALAAMFLAYYGRIDNLFLSYFNGDKAVGIYSAALNLVLTLNLIPSLICNAAFPKLSQYAFQNNAKFRDVFGHILKINFLMSLVISLVVFFLVSPIITLIYGKEYSQSMFVLQILIFTYPAYAIIGIIVYALNAKNKQTINSLIIGGILLLNIILDSILIPKYAYIGASFATLISIWVLSVFLFLYCFKKRYIQAMYLKPKYSDFDIFKTIIAMK